MSQLLYCDLNARLQNRAPLLLQKSLPSHLCHEQMFTEKAEDDFTSIRMQRPSNNLARCDTNINPQNPLAAPISAQSRSI